MAEAEEEYLSAYLFATGTTAPTLSYAQSLVSDPESGVHFVFPLAGAWDSMIVLQVAPGDLNAIRRLVTDLTDGGGDRDRVHHFSVAIRPLGRIKKREPRAIEMLGAMKTRAGVAAALFDHLQEQLDPPQVEVLVERVNGGYDLVCELAGQSWESMQGAVEDLRTVVGERATVDISYAAF